MDSGSFPCVQQHTHYVVRRVAIPLFTGAGGMRIMPLAVPPVRERSSEFWASGIVEMVEKLEDEDVHRYSWDSVITTFYFRMTTA